MKLALHCQRCALPRAVLIALTLILGCARTSLALAATCNAAAPVTVNVCASCTYKTLYAANQYLATLEPGNMVSRPYTFRLNGPVKVGGPTCNATASNCGDLSDWSWNLGGNTASCPVVIDALDAGNKPVLLRNTTQSTRTGYVLSISNVQYVTVRNLKIPDAAAGIALGSTDYSTIENNDFTIGDFAPAGGAGAISVGTYLPYDNSTQSLSNTIRNNTITYTAAVEPNMDAYWREDNEDGTGLPNTNQGAWHGHSLYHGIYLGHADSTVVSGNTIINAPGGAIHAFHNYTTNSAISGNTVTRCHNHPYVLADVRDTSVSNYVVDQHRWGVIVSGSNNVHGNSVTSNTFRASTLIAMSDPGYTYPLSHSNDLALLLDNPANNVLANTQSANVSNYVDSSSCVALGTTYQQRYDKRYNRAGTAVYQFVPGEIFVVQKDQGLVIKIANSGGTGHNMFALDGNYAGLPGYTYWLGTHVFKNASGNPLVITAMTYVGGYTLIGFADGHILKLVGTGGTGVDMFHVTADGAGFANDAGYALAAGSHRFLSGVRHILAANGYTFLTFDNKRVLKINGAGGSGYNLFAINESGAGFTTVPGYNFYAGDDVFLGKVTDLRYLYGYLFLAFDNKKLLKINGPGGSGHQLFAVAETTTTFASLPGYTFYAGYQAFTVNSATVLADVAGDLVIGFDTGRVLKIAGAGGGGANMFCIGDTAGSFNVSPASCTYYFRGFDKFAFNSRPVTQIIYALGFTLVGFADGEVVKLPGPGGNGGSHILAGSQKTYLRSSISSVTYTGSELFISTAEGVILKIGNLTGTGDNPFAIYREAGEYTSLWGYPFLSGSQAL